MIRLRNPEIIAKLERSTFKERNVIRTKTRSEDDLDDKETVGHVPESLSDSEDDEEQRRPESSVSETREFPGEARMTGPPLQITTTRSTGTETTIQTIMMYPVQPVQYPEVFTSRPQDIPLTEVPSQSHLWIINIILFTSSCRPPPARPLTVRPQSRYPPSLSSRCSGRVSRGALACKLSPRPQWCRAVR